MKLKVPALTDSEVDRLTVFAPTQRHRNDVVTKCSTFLDSIDFVGTTVGPQMGDCTSAAEWVVNLPRKKIS